MKKIILTVATFFLTQFSFSQEKEIPEMKFRRVQTAPRSVQKVLEALAIHSINP